MLWNVFFTFWAKRRSNNRSAAEVYQMLVKASRDPFLFEVVGVPDSPQGRFESVILHMFLLQRRLREAKSSEVLAQTLMDKMADDLDRSIREMGVGDLSVGKNVKDLLKMVHQRFRLYESGFDSVQGMADALGTVFVSGSAAQESTDIDLLEMYLTNFTQNLADYQISDIETASFSLPPFRRSDLSKNV
tara:strand:- start:447 stop:1013 length:567 start_codon:yes stop_codon:yes gene_type:complete